ncbi:hypothetical protein Tco_0999340 [Tanacetum coccineum]
MNPLTAHHERKTRKDRGMRRCRHSTSSSSTFDQPSSSHLNDDDDRNGEGTSHASTPSPITALFNHYKDRFLNYEITNHTFSYNNFFISNSSKCTIKNSIHQSKLQISPPSSNEPTSPQPLNPLLDNISDVPPRPSNPQPLQCHPFLDIILSLSPITPLDTFLDTPYHLRHNHHLTHLSVYRIYYQLS